LEREGYAVTVFNFEAAAVGAKHRRDRVFFVAHSRHIGFCQHKICCEQQGRAEVIGTNENMSVWSAAKMPKTVADTESREPREQEAGNRREGISGGSEKVDDVADTDNEGLQRQRREYGLREDSKEIKISGGGWWAVEPGLGGMVDGISCWTYEPNIPRVATGIKNRVDRLKYLGNAVVPQQVYPILKAIYDIETGGEDNGN
jgi:DNA (cytosine-5)-methyltransferase 1